MTAEERLKKLYDLQKDNVLKLEAKGIKVGTSSMGLPMKAKDIDLIADLVVERLKEEKK